MTLAARRGRHFRLSARMGMLGGLLLMTAGCAGLPAVQPQVNQLLINGQADQAVSLLERRADSYGRLNQLLYRLDQGLAYQLAGDYGQSIAVFAQAKDDFAQLYTQSVSRISASWLLNDYTRPYRGEDFERVLINIFQALNYASLGDLSAALVEARDVDSTLQAINLQYAPGQKNVYQEDAFARFLMGILYEASGTTTDLNDAYISYQKAYEIYTRDYQSQYGLGPPALLKENLLAVAEALGSGLLAQARAAVGEQAFTSYAERRRQAQVYVIDYRGRAPVKVESSLTLPLPDGNVTKLAFPAYQDRAGRDATPLPVTAVSGDQIVGRAQLVTAEDIGAIARENLASRRARTLVKALARPTGRYFLEKSAERSIEKRHGDEGAQWFRFLAGLFNIFVERADLRSWQTLPDRIGIARLVLEPGEYDLEVGGRPAGSISLAAGTVRFVIIRTGY